MRRRAKIGMVARILTGVAVLATAGCGGGAPSSAPPTSSPPLATTATSLGNASTSFATTTTTEAAVTTTVRPAPAPTTAVPSGPTTTAVPVTVAPATAAPVLPASTDGGPGTFRPDGSGPLNGQIVTVDPGHNGGSFRDPSYIDRIIFNGREPEACDTTGTETDAGYTEAQFTWNVARYLTADLRGEGATVVLTRTSNTGVGPCVTERAAIGNNAHANVAVSIHADGGPPGGRGFTILEPVADGINDAIIAPSRVLGADLRQAFEIGTGEPVADYYGVDGIEPRDDLGGTNLSTVPKVFVECANMRNATDAALVATSAWQARAAAAIAAGLTAFLHHP
jgi:N-acetylmuramoyl-L-alanine amidase